MRQLSRILSTLLHPLFMPLFCVLLVIFYSPIIFLNNFTKLYIAGVVGTFTLFIPLLSIILLYKLQVITDPTLYKREERTIPYIITIASYLFCGYFLYKINVPLWLTGLLLGGVASLLLATVITRWWKISAHLTGMGGLVACAVFLASSFQILPFWMLASLIMLSGFLGTARIYLNCHTLGQVLAGWANGFATIYLTMMLLS